MNLTILHRPAWLGIFVILCLGSVLSNTTEEYEGDDTSDEVEGHSDDLTQHWNYGDHGPDHWGQMFPSLCGDGKAKQSPINVQIDDVIYDQQLGNIDITFIESSEENHQMESTQGSHQVEATVSNNGHTASVSFNDDVYISELGPGLDNLYKAIGVHFHWGSDSSSGSEHTVDGHQYPLEMHMVSYDTDRFATITESLGHHQSLAVLGTLFKVSTEDNLAFDVIIDSLSSVQMPGSEAEIVIPDLLALLPRDLSYYYRYGGSLTTPHCYESVVWTLFTEPQTISERQLQQFRTLLEAGTIEEPVYIVDNWRPPQPLGKRKVYSSFDTKGNTIQENQDTPPIHTANQARTIQSNSIIVFISLTILSLTYYL